MLHTHRFTISAEGWVGTDARDRDAGMHDANTATTGCTTPSPKRLQRIAPAAGHGQHAARDPSGWGPIPHQACIANRSNKTWFVGMDCDLSTLVTAQCTSLEAHCTIHPGTHQRTRRLKNTTQTCRACSRHIQICWGAALHCCACPCICHGTPYGTTNASCYATINMVMVGQVPRAFRQNTILQYNKSPECCPCATIS